MEWLFIQGRLLISTVEKSVRFCQGINAAQGLLSQMFVMMRQIQSNCHLLGNYLATFKKW